MREKKKNRDVLRHFKSVRSALFAAISVMVLCAVVIVVAISLRFTRTSVFDNAVVYTRTIVRRPTRISIPILITWTILQLWCQAAGTHRHFCIIRMKKHFRFRNADSVW